MRILRNKFVLMSLALMLISNVAFAVDNTEKNNKRSKRPLAINVVPWGPTQADVDAAKSRISQSKAVQNVLAGVKYRLVAFEYIENSGTDKSQPTPVPTHFRIIFYDYTNDKAIVAENDFAGSESVSVREEYYDPNLSSEEILAANEIIKNSSEFGRLFSEKQLELYEAMPPVSNLDGERLVNIGVRNLATGENEIVGISFKNDKVVRYPNNAPTDVRVAPEACGITSSGGSTGQGLAGQYQMTVMQNGAPLWEMLIIRPSSSTGGEGSGIEVRDVKYKGKSVLKRGHAPVLNVKYLPGGNCNNFRDWQYAEGFFNAPATGATDPGPGFRVLADGQVATTAVETRVDAGNFQGVAVYREDVGFGSEVVMVTEMNAGWYRYIMEWRFAPDGTIRPRYGFGSTANSCTCSPRNHHVYWRFDFDIVQPNNSVFKVERPLEKGVKSLVQVPTEAAIFRNYGLNRGFYINNASGSEAYQIIANTTDEEAYFQNPNGGILETYGKGDFWLLKFQGTANAPDELNDPNSTNQTTCPGSTNSSAICLEPWLTGESLQNSDVVLWYGAHQYRVDDSSLNGNGEVISGVHVIGPDLRPVRW